MVLISVWIFSSFFNFSSTFSKLILLYFLGVFGSLFIKGNLILTSGFSLFIVILSFSDLTLFDTLKILLLNFNDLFSCN